MGCSREARAGLARRAGRTREGGWRETHGETEKRRMGIAAALW